MRILGIFYVNYFLVAGNEMGEFVVEYFSAKAVRMVTSTLCSEEKNAWLFKKFSERRIKFDCMDLGILNETKPVKRLSSRFFKLGVILDLKCPRSMDLLRVADENELFIYSNSLVFWLIITSAHVSKKTLETLAEAYAPEVTDPIKYLTQPYQDRKNEKYLLEINKKVNLEFIANHEKSSENLKKQNKFLSNETEIVGLLNMKILLDNEIVLAVPSPVRNSTLYTLFSVHKASVESRAKVLEMGRVTRGGRVELKGEEKRKNLGKATLRAASAIFQPEAFTTMDDLTTRESDVWSKMSYPHVKLLAEDLNFRLIIRFFDDYGWQTNGTFGHLMGFLQEKKADLSAAGLLMRTDRFGIVDFLECPFRLQTGILFREPSLSSVSNIFLLPFSKTIWISVCVAIILTVLALRCQIAAGKISVPPDRNMSDFFDIADYIVGAICQQGFSATPQSLSARISILIILLTSLALFTSYSACIVALLQSSSSAISTVGDITRSDLDIGIQTNFPLYKVLMQEATIPALKEFYERKVLPKGEKAFCDRRQGIEKMRTGMFAFEVELTAGYKLISETYEEREKCGIKEIDPIPKPFICVAVQKSSPYKEIFTERLIRQQEAGLFDRSWKLWVDQKPKCEVGRIGFISVGLTEFRPALQVFACGLAAAVLVLFVELLHKKKIILSFERVAVVAKIRLSSLSKNLRLFGKKKDPSRSVKSPLRRDRVFCSNEFSRERVRVKEFHAHLSTLLGSQQQMSARSTSSSKHSFLELTS